MTEILANSRNAVTLAATLRATAQAREADDGAIQAAIFHALAPAAMRWQADGAPKQVAIGQINVTVTLSTLAGRINPNLASPPLLTGLLHAVGVPGGQAARIAGNIAAWRAPASSAVAAAALRQSYRAADLAYGPPAAPFTDIGQISDVLGMTPALLTLLAPHLSLFQQGDPDPAIADAIVRQAIAFANDDGMPASNNTGSPVIRISACAQASPRVCRHAIAGIAGPGAQPPFQIKQLGDGP